MNTEDDEFARIAREQALNKMADNSRELGLDYELPITMQAGELDCTHAERLCAELKLAEPPAQQKPTAWRYLTHYKNQSVWTYCTFEPTSRMRWEALYTSPSNRTWVDLNDDDIGDIILEQEITLVNYVCVDKQTEFAKAIQAKLKKLNHET